MAPETRYALSGDVNIAYQVIGDAPIDLVVIIGWVSNLEIMWESPHWARFIDRLTRFARVIVLDKRGTGLSDRVPISELPTLEQLMDDVRAVMDAVGSERAALYGSSEGGAVCELFAATYPERTSALIMDGAYARRVVAPDYPWGITLEQAEAVVEEMRTKWGQASGLDIRAPSVAHDQRFRTWFAGWQRQAASPAAAMAIVRMTFDIDIRHILSSIRVPTLILHRPAERNVPVELSRYLAQRIPDAKYV